MDLLKDAVDLHVHTSPDVVERFQTDNELAVEARDAGMAGVVIKNHIVPTVGRVDLANESAGEEVLFGSVVLNGSVGGINPDAVEATLSMGGKIIWLPTLWSAQNAAKAQEAGNSYVRGQRIPSPEEVEPIVVDGELALNVQDVINLVADHDAVLATGHINLSDTFAVVDACADAGATCLVTHAFSDYLKTDIDVHAELVEKGAFLEYCALSLQNVDGHSPSAVAEGIQQVGPDHCVLSSDYGQANNPGPVKGLEKFAQMVIDAGAERSDVRTTLTSTPKEILGIN